MFCFFRNSYAVNILIQEVLTKTWAEKVINSPATRQLVM